MKNDFQKLLLIVISVILLAGCGKRSANVFTQEGNQYASGFALTDSAQYRIAVIYSPWEKGNEMARYYLTRDTSDSKEMARMEGKTVIRVPVERIGLTSCTHVGFLDALDGIRQIVGVCNPELVYTDLNTSKGVEEGTLNLGDAMAPNVERVVLVRPDVMMVSTYAQGDVTSAQMAKMGINVLYINEWMEEHPLARAEWIRLIGAFLDKESEANEVFASVSSKYEAMRKQVAEWDVTDKPSIMSGQDFRGTWYVPAGNTFLGRLFHDAGASYRYEDTPHEGSIPLTLEKAMVDFADADVWVGVNANSLDELAQIDTQHTMFRAFQEGRVYNMKHRCTPTGAKDFWERGVVHPEEILGDFISILYPDRMNWKPVFIEQLQ